MSNPPVRDVIKANNKYKQAYLDMFALIFVWNTTLEYNPQKSVENYSDVKDEIKKTINILNEPDNTNERYQLGARFPDDETFMGELKSKVRELYTNTFTWPGYSSSEYYKNLDLKVIAEITALMYLRLQLHGENNNIKAYTELARCIINTGKANLEYVDPFDGSTYLLQLLSKPYILQKLILDVIRTGKSNPGKVKKDKKTALILACEKNYIEIMEELLKQHNVDPFYQYQYKYLGKYDRPNSLEICLNKKKDPKFDPIKDKLNQMKINQVEMVTRAKRLPPDMTGEIVGYIHPDIKYQPPSNNSSNKGGRTRRKRNKSRKRKHNTSRKRKRNTSRKRKHRK